MRVGWGVKLATRHQGGRRSVALALGVCLCLLLIAMRKPVSPISQPTAHAMPSLYGFRLLGFQLTSQGGNRPDIRISGASLTLPQAPVLGPFRLGFAHALMIRDLTVEYFFHPEPNASGELAFPETVAPPITPPMHTIQTGARHSNDHQPSSLEYVWASLAQSLNSNLLSLVAQQGKPAIVAAEIRPLHIIQYRDGDTVVMFQAETCHLNRHSKITCKDGAILENGRLRAFREWSIETPSGP